MIPGRRYTMKIGARSVAATVTRPKYKLNVTTLERLATTKLDLNEIGVCTIATDRPIAFDPYEDNRDTGGFIVIDRLTNNTVGAGMIHFALRRSHNIHHHPTDVDKAARAGLSAAGIEVAALPRPGLPHSIDEEGIDAGADFLAGALKAR